MRWVSRLEPNNKDQSVHTRRLDGVRNGFWKRLSFAGGEIVRIELIRLFCLLPESGSGKDILEVSGGIFCKK